jgi:hypothetical protein
MFRNIAKIVFAHHIPLMMSHDEIIGKGSNVHVLIYGGLVSLTITDYIKVSELFTDPHC